MALRVVTEADPDARPAFEKHFRVSELAELWGMSQTMVRLAVENEPDIIRIGHAGLRPGKSRKYVTLRIPESVALRVHDRLTRPKR